MTTHEYMFPHHIVLSHIGFWTLLEVLAVRVWHYRVSCKKISLLHCILAFLLSSIWLARRFFVVSPQTGEEGDSDSALLPLYNFSTPGTFEHHIISFSMAYFIVDMPFALTIHRPFIVHHLICIVAFAAIQGYWKYLPESTPFFMDFMAWETTPSILDESATTAAGSGSKVKVQLLLGGLNGVFNLWMAELGGVFFHINRAFQDTDMELPSRGLFLFMFVLTRCCIWPLYLWHLYASQAQLEAQDQPRNPFHKASAVVETGLFLTNLHFLYKNIEPIYRTGRMLPDKPAEFHRRWLDEHPNWKRIAGLFLPKDKISMQHSDGGREGDSSTCRDPKKEN